MATDDDMGGECPECGADIPAREMSMPCAECGALPDMTIMHVIKITTEKLNELRMLADWQLREMGVDPDSVTAAVVAVTNGASRPLTDTLDDEEEDDWQYPTKY